MQFSNAVLNHQLVQLRRVIGIGEGDLCLFHVSLDLVVQSIDDIMGVTLVSESTLTSDFAGFEGTKTEAAKKVGELIAKKAQDAGITAVVFDRGGNKYHGRVAAVAEGAREGGLAL